MAVVVGVLLGVIIGAIPLALVYACLRRSVRDHMVVLHVAQIRQSSDQSN